MTREEAINVIENRFNIVDYCESTRLSNALDMAVNALNSENNLIDRALDIVHKTMLEFFDNDNEERPMNDKEKLLLSVNKAICNNLKSLKGGDVGNENT